MTARLSLEAFSGVVDTIYGASFDPAMWESVALQVNAITGSALSAFHIGDYATRESPLFFGSGVPENYFDLYLPVSHLNPILPSLALSEPGDLYVQSEIQTEEELFRSRFYRAFVEPLGLRDCTSVVCQRSGLKIAGFTTNSAVSRGPYTTEEIAFLRLLVPHLCRAITITDLFELQKIKISAIEAALDALAAAVFLLDGESHVLHLNQAAERMVRAAHTIAIRDRRLVAVHRSSQKALERGLRERRGAIAADGSVPLLSTLDGHKGMIATLLPLEQVSKEIASMRKTARWAVFVQDPREATPLPGEAFARLHHLTPTELRVALALAPGLSHTEAAQALGLSLPTIRTHLQRIFAKTGIHRQAELLRLMVDAMPPVAGRRGSGET